MTYKLPSPSVYQILTRASQELAGSELYPCLIGPLYRVVKLGTAFTFNGVVTSTVVAYPITDPGATVDLASISLTIENGVAEIASLSMGSTTGYIFAAGATSIITGTNMESAKVKPGDIVEVPFNGGKYTVDRIDELDKTKLWLTSTINFDIPRIGQTYTINRTYTAYTTTSGFTSNQAGITVTSLKNEDNKNFVSGVAKINYRAKRTDLTGFYRVTNLTTLKADMETSIENPLGFYLGNIMMGASGGSQVTAYIIPADTLSEYNIALSELTLSKEPYLLVPMSTNSAINQAVAAHCETMSQPDPSYFRCAILNTSITTTETVVSNLATVTL